MRSLFNAIVLVTLFCKAVAENKEAGGYSKFRSFVKMRFDDLKGTAISFGMIRMAQLGKLDNTLALATFRVLFLWTHWTYAIFCIILP